MADWSSLIGALGIGSVIGSLATQYLSAKARRQEWLNDNKKLEWRQLIDETDRSINWMRYAFERGVVRLTSDPATDYMAGMDVGSAVVRNRIFIADVLKESGIIDKWWELAGYVCSVDSRVTLNSGVACQLWLVTQPRQTHSGEN